MTPRRYLPIVLSFTVLAGALLWQAMGQSVGGERVVDRWVEVTGIPIFIDRTVVVTATPTERPTFVPTPVRLPWPTMTPETSGYQPVGTRQR